MVYASARAGRASLTVLADGDMPDSLDLGPLFATILSHIPAPSYVEGAACRPTSPTWMPRPTWAGWLCAGSSRAR